MTGFELGTLPFVTVFVPPLPAVVVQFASEYTVYVTVPLAFDVFAPASVAESVTAVPEGTVIAAPVWPPPPWGRFSASRSPRTAATTR